MLINIDDPTKNDFEILKMMKYIYIYFSFSLFQCHFTSDNHVKRTIIIKRSV